MAQTTVIINSCRGDGEGEEEGTTAEKEKTREGRWGVEGTEKERPQEERS